MLINITAGAVCDRAFLWNQRKACGEKRAVI